MYTSRVGHENWRPWQEFAWVNMSLKGYSSGERQGSSESSQQPLWEVLVCDAVGEVIEFWGFKRNHGRVWALLYVRQVPMTAAEIQEALELSKGAVSMISRDLEQWDIVRRVRLPGEGIWNFVAEVDFLPMIRRVMREREGALVKRVAQELEDAERMARADEGVAEGTLERLARMRSLARMIEHAMELFLKTSLLDIKKTNDVL